MDRGILTRIAAFVRAVKRTLLVYVEYHIIIASKKGMVQIRVDSSGVAGAAATHEFPIHLTRTVNTFPGVK
jgi:hypothetical protein